MEKLEKSGILEFHPMAIKSFFCFIINEPFLVNLPFFVFYNILSDCHNSDEIYYLLNAFRLDKKKFLGSVIEVSLVSIE